METAKSLVTDLFEGSGRGVYNLKDRAELERNPA